MEKRILIIDDDEAVRDTYKDYLTHFLKDKISKIITPCIIERPYTENYLLKKELLSYIKEQLKKGLNFIIIDWWFIDEFISLVEDNKLSVQDFLWIKTYLSSWYNTPSFYNKEITFLKSIWLDITFCGKLDYMCIINDIMAKL